MQRGPPHYHSGSSTTCYCVYSSLPQYAPSPYGQARPYITPGDPRDYAPPVRRVPKPKSKDKITRSREMKFDEDNQQWYFETKEAPGVKWLETVWHVTDLPRAKDPDFLVMLNEYYLCGHVMDPPDQDRLPVVPGGMKHWSFSRSRPPPPAERPLPPPPPQQGYDTNTWIEPIYNRHPSAPPYASGSAHPVSVRIPPGVPPPDGWRVHSNSPYLPQAITTIQEQYPPQHYPHRRHLVGPAETVITGDDSDLSDSEYYYDERERERAFIPPPSPKSRKRAEKLKARGYRVTDPHDNATLDEEPRARTRSDASATYSVAPTSRYHADQLPSPSHTAPGPYTYPAPFVPPSNYLPKQDQKIDIHRLLQTRSTLGIAKIPELVFDLRYDPKHAFDRAAAGGSDNEYWSGGGKGEIGTGDLARMPAFQPGQNFVRLVIRHPFNGRGGDWVEDIDEAKYLTVMDVVNIISEMVHMHIDQTLDWDPLSETDRSFVYEAYLNRPCPDEDATGRRLHLFCDKYMFGGIEQLPAKAKGSTAEGPSFLVKLMRNSKHKRYDRLVGFSLPRRMVRRRPSGRSHTTYPTLVDES
ncbi:hypothetical protein FRC10_007815, partial [Ceratobasidium sp. 414]